MFGEKNLEKKYEDACITLDIVEMLSDLVLKKLTDWANKEIFDDGLTVETPLLDEVNAGAVSYPMTPKKAKIIITMGMLFEIYRDSMVFPIYAEKLKRDTSTYNNALWAAFKDVPSKFDEGVPEVDYSELTVIGKLLVSEWHAANEKSVDTNGKNAELLARSLACRFQMFEFMVSWVFFHELSHIIQCHYRLKPVNSDRVELHELNVNSDDRGSYEAQAREILADIEGLDLTMRYLHREGVYNYKSFYFMLCAQTCMFNRFYSGKYEEEYFVIKGTHPHPVTRYEYICHFFSLKIQADLPLVLSHEMRRNSAIESVYATTKSSIISNLFWANRHENYQGGELTSFMKVQKMSETFSAQLYTRIINANIKAQLNTILKHHLYADSIMFNLSDMNFFVKKQT